MKYEMPAVTEDRRAELVNLLINRHAIMAPDVDTKRMEENMEIVLDIALAALTTKPTEFLGISDDDAEYNGIRHFSFEPETIIDLYRAPPVPALNPIELPRGFNPGIGDIFDKQAPVMRRDATDGKWLHKAVVAKILTDLGYEVKE